jgi:hypothetical protein
MLGCLAALVAGLVSPVTDASGRDGIRIRGEILEVRCGEDRQVALCRVGDQRALVDLTGASIFVNGEPARCGALQPGRRFAAFGRFVSREPLTFDACVFVSRAENERVTTVCGEIARVSASGELLIIIVPEIRQVLVKTDPDITRFSLNGERATIGDLAPGMRACATGILNRADPNPIMRPTRRVEARSGDR